mmetsp:Transcript_81688/g.189737  ORF Transcript_81688/g.189737 Transcript_81688/m.189737 type:complete len:223 (-) Transcript_81688:1768-2436(-)
MKSADVVIQMVSERYAGIVSWPHASASAWPIRVTSRWKYENSKMRTARNMDKASMTASAGLFPERPYAVKTKARTGPGKRQAKSTKRKVVNTVFGLALSRTRYSKAKTAVQSCSIEKAVHSKDAYLLASGSEATIVFRSATMSVALKKSMMPRPLAVLPQTMSLALLLKPEIGTRISLGLPPLAMRALCRRYARWNPRTAFITAMACLRACCRSSNVRCSSR